MADVQDGHNQGRTGVPARQSPSRKRHGRAQSTDPTVQMGQTPDEIVGGISQSYSTGMPGTAGASGEPPDVTVQNGQLDPSFSGLSQQELLHSGVPANTTGGHPSHGGETVTYTDPFGFIGGVNREVTVQGNIGGAEDWTKAIDGYSPGPTLPGLTNARPTDTGVGRGSAKTEKP